MKIGTLAPWYGSNRTLARHVAAQLAGRPWVGVPFAGGMSEVRHLARGEPGSPRTLRPVRSKFDTDLGRARDELLHELKRLGAADVVLSSNLRLRLDGLPYADQREPDDPAVAVYFSYKGRPRCFACDRWNRVRDNVQAIRHTIESLRGIARWGTGDMVEAAFTGYAMLPPPAAARIAVRPWHEVLGASGHASTDAATAAYRTLAKEFHPDRNPGDADAAAKYAEVDDAYTRFKRERGL